MCMHVLFKVWAQAENPVHRIGLKVLNLGIHKRNGLGLR